MAIPLSYAGHPGLMIDTGIAAGPGLEGVTYGPAGDTTLWTITTTLLDQDQRTILLGFVSFDGVSPRRDTLARLAAEKPS